MGEARGSIRNFGHMSGDDAPPPPKPDPPARVELKKRIREAFKVFDEENNSIADVREVGTIMRSLGVNPTEKELHGMLALNEEDIIRAFRALDTDGKGYLTTEELRELMTKNEEHFSSDEISEMITFAVDADTGNCNFTEYAEKVANF